MSGPIRTPPIDTTGWPAEARVYVERLQAIIERDRTVVARGARGVRDALKAHEWLRLGRGSYEHDDDRWMDEFGQAFDAINEALEPLWMVARNLNDSPVSPDDVAAARAEIAPFLHQLRMAGWRVGVHNDYAIGGKFMSFWMFTHPETGRFVKGEAESDFWAISCAMEEIAKLERQIAPE